jgi:hypothetical protein
VSIQDVEEVVGQPVRAQIGRGGLVRFYKWQRGVVRAVRDPWVQFVPMDLLGTGWDSDVAEWFHLSEVRALQRLSPP